MTSFKSQSVWNSSRKFQSRGTRRRSRPISMERLEARQLLAATLFRINVGGPEIAATPVWAADTKAAPSPYVNAAESGNMVASVMSAIDTSSATLPAGIPEALFQSRRNAAVTGTSLAPMEWDFPVTPGSYEVRLYFAETWAQYDLVGERVFDVAIEGATAATLDNVDIVAQAGGRWKAHMVSTVVTSDSNLDIDFAAVVQNPTLSAIEIIQLDPGVNVAPVLSSIGNQTVVAGSTLTIPVTATDANVGDVLAFATAGLPSFVTFVDHGNGTGELNIAPPTGASGNFNDLTVSVSDNALPPLSDAEQFSVSVSASSTTAAPLYRVNAGGPEIAGSPVWSVDTKATPSPLGNGVLTGNSVQSVAAAIDLSHPSVPVGTPEQLFKTRRSDSDPAAPNLEYAFPVEDGQYEVRLYFAETWHEFDLPGERVFDVSLEGVVALNDYDIVADAGARWKGVVKTLTTSVTDGNLQVSFAALVDNPTIGAIEVIALGLPANEAPVLAAVGNVSVNEGATIQVPISATDPDAGDTLTLSASNLPSFATLIDNGDGTGVITISPPVGAAGSYSGVSIIVNDNGTPVLQDAETIVITVGAEPVPTKIYRVNAGGAAVADWAADTFATPSQYVNSAETNKTTLTTNVVDLTHPSVPAGTPEAIFQSERWDQPASITPAEMQWSFPVAPGDFEVRLFFAETHGPNQLVGKRKFDVLVEGGLVLDDYDIFADVGANKGVMKSFIVTSDSLLNIELGHVVENPAIKAIEIISLAGPVNNVAPVLTAIGTKTVAANVPQTFVISATDQDAGQVLAITATNLPAFATFVDDGNGSGTLTIAPQAGDVGSYTASFTVTDNGSPALSDSETITIQVTAEATPVVLYRVNAGGPAIAGVSPWLSDLKSSPSVYVNAEATTNKTTLTGSTVDITDPSIPAGTPMSLFQSERWDPGTVPELQWDFPVTAGLHEVRLYFADTFTGTQVAGARVFDVSIEGATVLNDFDIFAAVGGFKGLVKSFVVNTDSNIDIDFGHVIENPIVKAIEIISLPSAPNVLTVTPGSIEFGSVPPGSSQQRTLSLRNSGDVGDPDITISEAAISGDAGYSVTFGTAFPIVLAPGASTTATVTFSPTTAQSYQASLKISHSGIGSESSIALTGSGATAAVDFGKSLLAGASIVNPTSLQFGPDGRLYVAEQDGLIKAFTIQKNGANDFIVTATETISLIQQIPNHDDDGNINTTVTTRLVTGLVVTGTAANPVIYVGSSDPRIGGGPSGTDLGLDTNAGVISRLTKSGSSWTKLDLVRGLARSKENHTINGLQLIASTNTLLVAAGGTTNMGAPSNNFALLPEYALSAAILSIDLNAIGNTTYDIPTLDDEDRTGASDFNDPFGGNKGKNQAMLVPGGPVQVYSPGFRNPYDVIVAQSGKIYTIDNGPNAGWGDIPIGEGPEGNATNQVSEPGAKFGDALHLISQPGYYGGHPNPTRSNMNNTFNASNPQSPVSVNNPIESDYQPPIFNAKYPGRDQSLTMFSNSTGGMAEYTASAFGGAMQNNLLTTSFDNTIKRIVLSQDGTQVVSATNLFNAVGAAPLDVTTAGDAHPFAGSIWVADYAGNSIVIYDPATTSGGCPGDDDCDGYTNEDEIANGTAPDNGADFPPDYDADLVSNLSDPDDDNDAVMDESDGFAIDALNGMGTGIGTLYTWENDENAGKLLELGFTGLMANGADNYEDLYNSAELTAGGAAGVLTLAALHSGTALGSANTQDQAFQWGFNASATGTDKFVAKTSVAAPFNGVPIEAGTEFGFYLGLGDQDNFVQLVISGNNGGQIRLVKEVAGVTSVIATLNTSLANVDFVNLDLVVDPVALNITAVFQKSVSGVLATPVTLTNKAAIPATWLNGSLAIGVIGTDPTPETPVTSTWDFLGVVPQTVSTIAPSAFVDITPIGGLNASTFPFNSIYVTNTAAAGGPKITSITFDVSSAILPDIVFDPAAPAAGDTVFRPLVVSTGANETGFIEPVSALAPFSQSYQGGYRKLTLNFTDFGPGELVGFAADIDPTTIKGQVGQGADWAGSISGLELSGSTVTISFNNGSTHTGTVFAVPGTSGGQGTLIVKPSPPVAPAISLVGNATTPTTVFQANQTVRVTGAPGAKVRLLAVEGALEGLPDEPLFDPDPFEANNVRVVQKFTSTIGSNGTVDIPVIVENSVANGGLYHFAAVIEEADGRTGALSNVLVIQVDPNVNPNPAFIEAEGLVVMEVESRPTNDGWALENSVSGYTDSGYFRWTGPDSLNNNQAGVNGLLEYKFIISNPGVYQLRVHNHRDSTAVSGEANDAWARLDAEPWQKIFSTAKGNWNWTTRFDIDEASGNQPAASYNLAAGEHTLYLSGRSTGWRIDRIALFNTALTGSGVAQNLNTPESTRESTTSGATFTSMNVNQDSRITPQDALLVINSMGASTAEGEFSRQSRYNTDVNRDGKTTALDALLVINHLSRQNRYVSSLQAVDLDFLDEDEDRAEAVDAALESFLYDQRLMSGN